MPADLRNGTYAPGYVDSKELHKQLTSLARRNDSDTDRREQAGDLSDLIGCGQSVRDCEPFSAAITVRDDDVNAPIFTALVPRKSIWIDTRRANLNPKWTALII